MLLSRLCTFRSDLSVVNPACTDCVCWFMLVCMLVEKVRHACRGTSRRYIHACMFLHAHIKPNADTHTQVSVCVCLCVCVWGGVCFALMYVCTYACLFVLIHKLSTYIWMHINILHTCLHAYIHTNIHTYIHGGLYRHIHVYNYIHAYIHTCVFWVQLDLSVHAYTV